MQYHYNNTFPTKWTIVIINMGRDLSNDEEWGQAWSLWCPKNRFLCSTSQFRISHRFPRAEATVVIQYELQATAASRGITV